MPYVSVSASVPLSGEKKSVLQREIGTFISIIPGKNIDNTMIKIEGDCDMYMGDAREKAVFCEIRLLGDTSHENKSELYQKLRHLFFDELDIEKLYLNYSIFEEWGAGDSFRKL